MSGGTFGVAVRTLGCKVNQADTERIATDLVSRGGRFVPEEEAAVVIVNTCTVTGEADAKARKAVRHALGSTNGVVVVTGCLAVLDGHLLRSLGDRVLVVADKGQVVGRVAAALGLDSDGFDNERRVLESRPAAMTRATAGLRTRAMLKVEDGCDASCSYCIVPQARGVPASVRLYDVIREASSLVDGGVREIVVTGVNLGRYADGSRRLSDVIEAVAATGVRRIRVSSIEPLDLTDDLLEALSSIPALCPHLHVPLQSGSDGVLLRMGRLYSAGAYAERISTARQALPGLAVTTDVIAGFPGEGESDAEETLAFCADVGFSRLHVFRYSERKGTPAAGMPGRIRPQVRAARAMRLRELDARLRRAFAASHEGAVVEVLVEKISGDADRQTAEGVTRDYLRVQAPVAASMNPGDLLTVRIVDSATEPVSGVVQSHAETHAGRRCAT